MNRFSTTTQNRFSMTDSTAVLPTIPQKSVLDPNLQISQAPTPSLLDRVGKFFEPVVNFLTNTTPRERGTIQSAAVTHQPQDSAFTSTKIPFVNTQIPQQKNFLTDTVKYLVETPERFMQTLKDSQILATKGFVPPSDNGKLSVDSYVKIHNDFYENAKANGSDDISARIGAGLFTVGQGILDATLVGSLLEKSAIGLLDSTANTVAKKQAWEVLGMPKTAEEAQVNYLKAANQFHPDKGGDETIFKIINNANQVIKKEGIPSIVEQKVVPNVRQWAKMVLSSPGADVSAESVANPMIAGQLPGNAPIGGKTQPKFGLSIQPVESVGGPTELPNIKPKTIRDEAKIAELQTQKGALQMKQEAGGQMFDQQTESNYQQFKQSISRFKDIPEDVPQYKATTGRGTETDNLLYSQTLNEDEMYQKFLDRYESDKKTVNSLTDLQAQLKEVKGKAIKDYTPEQLDRINAITQDAVSLGKRETLPVAKTLKEFQSTARQADQTLSKVPEVYRQRVSSLPKIISESNYMSNTQKVNVVDYLRTPDRVLNKIGLFSESKILQKGYNAYVKELPKNIDKITEWSKEVPKESSKTIFQYLDGKKVDLNPVELKVANEIKQWLQEWAVRLKLPEDKTITNYITHIFDKELIAKEFDEDLAKIITDKVPGSVYDPFLLERLGAKGYKQNVWEALDAYVKRGTRKANMDDALKAIQDRVGSSLETSKVDVSAFKYIQRYISGVNMRPTELDNLLDNSIKNLVGYKYGQRPVTYLTKLLRQMTYRGMLGLNVSSAFRNISQGINTYATLGEKYTAVGYMKLFSKDAFTELLEQGVLDQHFIQDRALSSTKKAIEKIDKGLFAFFEAAEKINRGSAYFGAKAKALAQGKTLEEAMQFGIDTVRKTQFTFGSVDTPVALQSDIVKTIAQLQNFTLKQTEFLAEMAKDKNFVGLIRYAVAGLVFVYTIGKAFGMEPKELLPNFRFDTPPSLKFPVEVGKAILNVPDKYGNQRDLGQKAGDIGKSAIGLIPASSQINKTIGGIKSISEGGSYTKNNKLQFKQGQSFPEEAQSVIFGKYASQNAKNYFNKKPKSTVVPSTANRFSK